MGRRRRGTRQGAGERHVADDRIDEGSRHERRAGAGDGEGHDEADEGRGHERSGYSSAGGSPADGDTAKGKSPPGGDKTKGESSEAAPPQRVAGTPSPNTVASGSGTAMLSLGAVLVALVGLITQI